MNDQELLKYMQDNNIIDMAYVQEQIEMKKRKDILNKHPYRVWLAQDGYWKTYFPKADGTKRLIKKKKQNSGLTVSNNTRPVDKHVNNDVQKTVSLYLRWNTGSADLQKKSRHPNLNRIWSLSDFHLNRKLPESCSLRNLHRCVFLFQTISVLKYLIPAERN